MTTAAWTSVLDQTSDAAFRTWVAEFIAKCLAVGLTQTSDTGQINTATVTRAAINTDAGYAIFRFNDTQQSTAPVFIKILFGSGSATTVPRIRVQLGTASNGLGTVSGNGSTNTDTISASSAAVSTATLYPSYMCCVDGFWGFVWKVGAYNGFSGASNSAYVICRSVDNTGAATADAVSQTFGPTTFNARTINFSNSTVYSTAALTDWTAAPYGQTSSLSGGVPQVFKTYNYPTRLRPQVQTLYVISAEFSIGTEADVAVVGATSRHYIAAIPTTTSRNLMMLWE